MKLLLVLIFAAYVLTKVFEYLLEYLNYKHLKAVGSNIPKGFEKVIDQKKLDKIKNYTTEKIYFGLASSIYGSVILIIFIFSGLLNWYNKWIVELKLPFVVSALLFFLLIFYAQTLLKIPFSLYGSFKIEKKHGFNTMTFKLWITDLIKTLLISTILFSILCAGALYLVYLSPQQWWLWVWVLFLIFTVFMMYLSPYVLEPLFNKFVPVDDEHLSLALKKLMKKVGIKITKVLKMDASKRTKHTNAYFSGIGHVKRIVLFDTMLEKMNENEILSVVAHEGGHWKKKHILKNIILIEALSLLFFFIAYLLTKDNFLLSLFNINFGPDTGHLYLFPVKIFILQFLTGIVLFPFSPLLHVLSRKYERQADKFAVELVGRPEYLVDALVKLSADNLSNLHPHPLYAAFHYSHPDIQTRIKYISDFNIEKTQTV